LDFQKLLMSDTLFYTIYGHRWLLRRSRSTPPRAHGAKLFMSDTFFYTINSHRWLLPRSGL
ncbi:MAG: hypothetical protein KAW12_00420, partial [Candidatus Aminicenantes bacterium]|nr:hypothetical protein [Candidatus Aminicenantes bacterium]